MQKNIKKDAIEQLMEAGGLTALTQAHFNEAMKTVAQRFINVALQGELKHHLSQEDEKLSEEELSVDALKTLAESPPSTSAVRICSVRRS